MKLAWCKPVAVSISMHVCLALVVAGAWNLFHREPEPLLKPGEELTWIDLDLEIPNTDASRAPIASRSNKSASISSNAAQASPAAEASGTLEPSATAKRAMAIHIRDRIRTKIKREAMALAIETIGEIEVQFSLTRSGSLATLALLKSSGSHDLDQLALAAMRRAEPYPYLPGEIVVPLVFR